MLRSLDYLGIGCATYVPVQGITSACENFCRLVRMPLSRVIGLTPKDITHPDDLAASDWLLTNALHTRQPYVLRKRYLLNDGVTSWVENRYTIMRNQEGETSISLMSRGPTEEDLRLEPQPCASGLYSSYLEDMTKELAVMADRSRLLVSRDLLRLVGVVAHEETSS